MKELLERAHAIGRDVLARHVEDVDRQARFPRESIAALKEARLLGTMVPRELGGDGTPLAGIIALGHVLGQYCSATGMIFAMHQIQVACLVRHGLENHRLREIAAEMTARQWLLASATTEAGVGGDVRSSICAIEDKDGGFALTKQASVISYGDEADGILATARRSIDAPASDQVLTVLLAADYRLERTSGWDTLGMRGTCSNGYVLRAEGARDQILPLPYAEISARTMLPVTHLTWAGLWLGIATDAMTRARSFIRAEARKRGGAPPGATRLAQAMAMLQSMQANVVASTRHYEQVMDQPDQLTSMSFAMALNALKTNVSQMAVQVIGEAMLICGIAGYRNDGQYSLGRHLRDAHSAAIMVNNDRITGNTANLLLVLKDIPELFA